MLLEALLPGFHWLTFGSLLLGVVETFVYGAFAGLVFAVTAILLVAAGVVAVAAAGSAQPPGHQQRDVTVQEVFALKHRLDVEAGTIVAWKDPHFERVWFPSGGGPAVTRTPSGPVTLFDTLGEYHGRFTVAGGGHGATGEVFPITVVVRRPGA